MTTIRNPSTTSTGTPSNPVARTLGNTLDTDRKTQGATIAAGTVSAAQLAPGAVVATDIADGSVTTTKLAAGAVTAPALGALAVGTAALADAGVTTAKHAPGSVTGAKMAPTGIKFLGFTGVAAPGPATLTGAQVGDRVIGIIQTDATDLAAAAKFEATITVANQIQQSSVSDLSTHRYAVFLLPIAS